MTEPMSNANGTIPISSRQMVRFTTNVLVEIALQCADGVRVEGRYGDRVKYSPYGPSHDVCRPVRRGAVCIVRRAAAGNVPNLP